MRQHFILTTNRYEKSKCACQAYPVYREINKLQNIIQADCAVAIPRNLMPVIMWKPTAGQIGCSKELEFSVATAKKINRSINLI